MTALFRRRVKKAMLTKTDAVTKSRGTSAAGIFRIFVAKIVRIGRMPTSFKALKDRDVLDIQRRNKIWSELDDAKTE